VAGFTGVALADCCRRDHLRARNLRGRRPIPPPSGRRHFAAKPRVSFFLVICRAGRSKGSIPFGLQGTDMSRLDGRTLNVRTFGRAGSQSRPRVGSQGGRYSKTVRPVRQYVSDDLPATLAPEPDDIGLPHSMNAGLANYGSGDAADEHRPRSLSAAPCIGSWVN